MTKKELKQLNKIYQSTIKANAKQPLTPNTEINIYASDFIKNKVLQDSQCLQKLKQWINQFHLTDEVQLFPFAIDEDGNPGCSCCFPQPHQFKKDFFIKINFGDNHGLFDVLYETLHGEELTEPFYWTPADPNNLLNATKIADTLIAAIDDYHNQINLITNLPDQFIIKLKHDLAFANVLHPAQLPIQQFREQNLKGYKTFSPNGQLQHPINFYLGIDERFLNTKRTI